MSPILSLLFFVASMILTIGFTPVNIVFSFSIGQPASYVIGQPDFKSASTFGGGLTTSSRSLNTPTGLAIDHNGNLWIGDNIDFRVLEYKVPFDFKGKAADVVLGQPDFATSSFGTCCTQKTIVWIEAITFDSSGNLWVADRFLSRVLRFTPPFTNGMEANLLIGQPSYGTISPLDPPSTKSLNHPAGLAFDSKGNLWVSDTNNNRVLRFSPPFTNYMAADVVLGQPDFVTSAVDAARDLRGRMDHPMGIAFSNLDLWVSDSFNNRILKFSPTCSEGVTISTTFSLCLETGGFTNGQPADVVLGQPDFTTIKAADPPSTKSLNHPAGLAFDSKGNLWVSDTNNNRVLQYTVLEGYYATIASCHGAGDLECVDFLYELANVYADLPSFFITNGQKADLVIGKSDFVTRSSPGFASANTLNSPTGLAFDSKGNLWVADTSNNRILGYVH